MDREGNKGTMRHRQKGWIGYVRSFDKYLDDSFYDEIKWGEPEDSGAKEIINKGNKTIYKF
jgi:hypothetical protein